MNHEQEAKNLDEIVSKNAVCHDPAVKPFEETAGALMREASNGSAQLDANTAKRQRNTLMAMAEKQSTSEHPVTPNAVAPRRWSIWAGSFATVTLALLIAVIIVKMPGSPLGVQPTTSVASVARLVIPEAHASDAFNVIAEKSDRTGIDSTTGFVVTTTVAVSTEELIAHLKLVPALADDGGPPKSVTVAVVADGANRFRVTPKEALAPGKVYRISVSTDIQQADGSFVAREFSWAMQTKQVFRVISSVPATESNGVPVNTGIEFAMSQAGWTDATSSIVTTPHIDGHLETHGRSLVFVPSKPLKHGSIYTVTLKKGLKLAGSDLTLEADSVVQFETEAPPRPPVLVPHLWLNEDLVETSPGKETEILAYWENDAVGASIKATGYAISMPEAKSFLEEYGMQPQYAIELKKRGEIFSRRAVTKAFESDATIETRDYQTLLRLPGVPAGRYVVKIQPEKGEASWIYLESTNVATYVISDAAKTVVWAMNVETKRPLENMTVAYDTVSSKTDQNGIANIATPKVAVATTTGSVVMSVGEGALSSLILLRSQGSDIQPWYRYGYGRNSAIDQTVSFMYADRPLYHLTDKVLAFGLIQDRESRRAPANATLELTRSGIYDYFFPTKQKVYRSISIVPDEQGFFRTSLDWDQLSPGYYRLALKRDGAEVFSRSIEIRSFVKPTYTIEVVTKRAVFAGDTIEGEARVTFFNGTPVAGMALSLTSYGAAQTALQLTTDENGRATFRLPTTLSTCDLKRNDVWCNSTETATIEVRPSDGEEAQISGTSWVNVWRSKISLETSVKTKDGQATLSFVARKVDLQRTAEDGGNDVLGEASRGARITGRIIERTWQKVEDGQYYDYIEKKSYPRYRYESKERDVAQVDLTTDAEGKATLPFTMNDNVSYRLIVSTTDERGGLSPASESFAKGWWSDYSYGYERGITLEPTNPQADRHGYHVGERISLGLFNDGALLETTDAPNYLFVEAHLGIKATTVSKSATYEFPFTEEHVPNVKIRGVLFKHGDFVEREFETSIDVQDRNLKVVVTPDQTSYAPGAKAKLRVTVKDKDGKGVASARVALGTVDEAVFAAAQMDGEERPLDYLYTWVSDGILVTKASHQDIAERAFAGGGAEMGGGGGDSVRRNFKDTASFEVVTTDRNGEATQEVSLPDNLTSWRVSAVAVSANWYAGTGRTKLDVTKPVFVDVVAPSPVLATDKPTLKLRAFGAGLKDGDAVTFTVDAPALGLTNVTATGTANRASYVTVNSLPVGSHKLIIRVTSSRGTDALEKKLDVLTSRLTTDELTQTDLAPGVALPDAGASREVDVEFVPKTRAQYLWRIRSLANPWSARLEAHAAARVARKILKEQFDEKDVQADEPLSQYQKVSGGLAILPYASEDPDVTAKIAALIPDAFDRTLLAKYFWDLLSQSDVSREEQAQALSGLAAVGQPVLPELHELSQQKDLQWQEQLAVMRGLEAAGDREAARALLEAILAKGEEHDGKLMIRVSDEEYKRYQAEATAEVAVIAAALAHPSAPKLNAWLESNWAEDAMTDIDRVAYLARVVPAAQGRDVTVSYTVGGSEQTFELKDGMSHTETFTADELKAFRVTKVNGPVVAIMTHRVAKLPTQSPNLTLTRGYEKVGGGAVDTLVERDTIRVNLAITWKSNAQDGCYTVRDHLPAGLSALVSVYFDQYGSGGDWYPADVNDNEVAFVACKSRSGSDARYISYRARVIARGTYTAEPAVLQSMDAPSHAALTPTQTVTVK